MCGLMSPYEMGSFSPSSPYGCFFSHIAKRGFKVADMVSTVSVGKAEKLRERVPAGTPVELVPNGIDEAFVENEEDLAVVERFDLEHGPICCYVGNIGLAQGLGTLLDIASVRSDVRFLLFGAGADKKALEQRAKVEGLSNVEFCGSVDARGVYTVLRYSALSYVPLVSSRLRDSVPTKLYECVACGCPVLLAAQGDSVDLLEETGLGAHAAPEDHEGLLRAFDGAGGSRLQRRGKDNCCTGYVSGAFAAESCSRIRRRLCWASSGRVGRREGIGIGQGASLRPHRCAHEAVHGCR